MSAPAAASAAPPATTPGQSGVSGCAENGQAVAGLAKGGAAFGQTAAANAPIAPVNATFFGIYCSGS